MPIMARVQREDERRENAGPLGRGGSTPRTSAFTTRAQLAFKSRAWPRFAGAAIVALAAIALLVLLGPNRDEVRKRFVIYGAEGEIRLMPEISIDDGTDPVYQLPESFRDTPPPDFVIEPDEPRPDGVEVVPPVVEEARFDQEGESDIEVVDADVGRENRVELTLPQQTSRDFRILELVRPLYPAGATEAERRTPEIRVEAAIFVGPDGLVRAAMVTGGTGGPVFQEEALRAMRQWVFQWLIEPPPQVGRWIEMTWRFKGPQRVREYDGGGQPWSAGAE